MSNIWIVCEQADVAAQLLTPALELAAGKPVYAITVGAENASKVAALGASKVWQLNLQDGRPESAVKVIADTIKEQGASVVLFGATPRGRGIAATVAALLDAGMASEVSAIKAAADGVEAQRYIIGGVAVSTLAFSGLSCVTVTPNTFAAPEAAASAGEIVAVDVPADSRVTVVETAPVVSEGVDLAAAPRVVCVGRGVEKQEDLAMVQELCAAFGAEIACSRGIAEDLKWLPLERYIGISGVKVKADVHISLGVSGQVQHVAGIRDAKTIIAVDTNENAPIFAAADYGIVGNLYDVVPALTKALKG